MGKELMKRSLVLGALMAFVITGNAWAEEVNRNEYYLPEGDFEGVSEVVDKSKLMNDNKAMIISANNYKIYSNPKLFNEDKPNKLETTQDIIYKSTLDSHKRFNIYAGYATNESEGKEADNNLLVIKHNLTVYDYCELYGSILSYESDSSDSEERIVSGNGVEIKGVTLKTVNDDKYIGVIGALAQGQYDIKARDNYVIIEDVVFVADELYVYGGESRGAASLDGNQVEIINTNIEIGTIAGAYGDGNTQLQINKNGVTIDGTSKIACDVYGGLNSSGTASDNSINIKGNADVSEARLHGDNGGAGTGNTLNLETGWNGIVGSTENFNIINVGEGVEATFKAPIVANEQNTVINIGYDDGEGFNEDGEKESLLIGQIITEETGTSSVNFIDGGIWEVTGKSNVNELQGDTITLNVDKVEKDLVTITNGVSDEQNIVLNVTDDDLGVDVTAGVQTMVDTIVDGYGKSVFEKITDEEIDLKATVDANISEDGSVQDVITTIKPGDGFVIESDVEVVGGLKAADGKFSVDTTTGNVTAETYNNIKVEKNVDGDAIINNVNINKLDAQVINNTVDINVLNQRLENTNSKINKVGAGAAALAALHPLDFDPDDKLSFSAGVGNYGGETASALGMYYRPTEKVMLSAAGTIGNGENMVNMGVTFALDKTNNVSNSRVAMAREIQVLREQVAALTALVTQLAGRNNPALMDTVMFPDVPENHWAYDYIEGLQKRGIVEGYPDGNFGGDRSMTRYEYAAMLYRALEKGFPVDSRLLDEFDAELGRIRIDRIKGLDNDANKIERVRVNNYEDRDDYGSKLITKN